jgi:choline kinase
MDAIILAAGRGERLREFNPDGRPKCLLEFAGKSLLARQLECLQRSGVRHVELVLGYEADQVIEHVGTLSERPEVSFVYNPHFLDGSVISLLTARDCLLAGRDVLVIDADVLFDPRILQRLVEADAPNVYLFDAAVAPGDERLKIALHVGQIVEFRTRLPAGLAYDRVGESPGLCRFDAASSAEIATACAGYAADGLGDAPHQEALRDVLLAAPERFAVEDISGLPWLKVATPDDLERAIKQVLPAIQAKHPHF